MCLFDLFGRFCYLTCFLSVIQLLIFHNGSGVLTLFVFLHFSNVDLVETTNSSSRRWFLEQHIVGCAEFLYRRIPILVIVYWLAIRSRFLWKGYRFLFCSSCVWRQQHCALRFNWAWLIPRNSAAFWCPLKTFEWFFLWGLDHLVGKCYTSTLNCHFFSTWLTNFILDDFLDFFWLSDKIINHFPRFSFAVYLWCLLLYNLVAIVSTSTSRG